MKRKVAVEKTLNRAGATRLFRLSAAQKVHGVAPALAPSRSGPCLSACRDRSKQLVMRVVLHREKEKEQNSCHC